MRSVLASLGFSRVLAGVMLANVGCMSLCNALRLPVGAVVGLYPMLLIVAWAWLRTGHARRVAVPVSRGMVVAAAGFALLVAVPRVVYPLEWLPGNTVHVSWDDYGRLGQLASMTLADAYPLPHFATGEAQLSFYYAALYPMAWLKLAVPVLTLKDTLFLGQAAYAMLLAMSLLELIQHVTATDRGRWLMLYLCTLFGGLDAMMSMLLHGSSAIGHHEWWQRGEPLHGNAQLPSFLSTQWWAMHHTVGLYALPLTWLLLTRLRITGKAYLLGLLLVSAAVSSAFGALSLPLFAWVERRVVVRRMMRATVALPLIAVALPALLVFTGKLEGAGFTGARFHLAFTGLMGLDRVLSLPLWMGLIIAVELGGIPLLLWLTRRSMSPRERSYALAAGLFLLSTYLLAFTGANNYALRGSVVPVMVLFALAARRLPPIGARWRPLAAAWLVIMATTTALEWLHIARKAQWSMALSHPQDRRAELFPVDTRALARDARSWWYAPPPGTSSERSMDAEKLCVYTIDDLAHWQREIARLPPAPPVPPVPPAPPSASSLP